MLLVCTCQRNKEWQCGVCMCAAAYGSEKFAVSPPCQTARLSPASLLPKLPATAAVTTGGELTGCHRITEAGEVGGGGRLYSVTFETVLHVSTYARPLIM
ncbi:hypothetical protein E2C01_070472 [Portunus trituberculatus]|uniref:Uncharacterized protein n=1 Tax=Portunus trituberculatus TaxID=210409 RepID=A0A5B7HST4_PORTR|nr:hypothetical protein [Portunus trituberculatus]